jgi:prephenate dehydratase
MIRYGIQGGVGSFNEEAALEYQKCINEELKIVYLYTTEHVFEALSIGKIDLGQFALINGVGGIVAESLESVAKHTFEVITTINLTITHHIMKRKDADNISKLMAHSQVFKQCKHTLVEKYPDLELIEGKGDLMDTARAAEALANGEIDKNIGIIGPASLARLHDFEFVAHDLQDSKHNITTFVVVKCN